MLKQTGLNLFTFRVLFLKVNTLMQHYNATKKVHNMKTEFLYK